MNNLLKNLLFPLPPAAYHFDVKLIDDLLGQPLDPKRILLASAKAMSEAGFQEVSGFSATMGTEPITEGGENKFIHNVPTQVTYPNLQLKRGAVTRPSALNMWCEECLLQAKYPIETKIIVLTLLDVNHIPLMVWKFDKAYPVKYEVAGFNAESNQLLIESIEIAYQKVEKIPIMAQAAMAGANLAVKSTKAAMAEIPKNNIF